MACGTPILHLPANEASVGAAGDLGPLDLRICALDVDGKTKNAHFREMLVRAVADKRLQARTVLFDSWYAAADNLKLIQRLALIFFTTLKEDRLVSLSKEDGYMRPWPRRSFKTRTPYICKSKNCIGAASNSRAAKSVNAARRARNAIIWPVAIMPGSHSRSRPCN